MPGHLLVIPKRHVEHLHDLSLEERAELFKVVITLQQRILERFASGCDIRQHNRPFLPENDLKVDHLHVHLQPREMEDELYQKSQRFDRKVFAPLPDGEIEEVRSKLF
jgi:Diadenosine tetraphosphate (Ap4A) hydrolase and other HIT family hydrolases